MSTTTSFNMLIHDNGGDLKVTADAWGERWMSIMVTDIAAAVELRISAVDAADLHNLLMRMLTAAASTAARERPDEPEPAEYLERCDACGDEPVSVNPADVRLCAGCALERAGVGA